MNAVNDPHEPERVRADRRLDSWKSIGAFFGRDERTVRRWEAERGMPVHRVPGAGRSSVYAYASELAEWLKTADLQSPDGQPEARPRSLADVPVAATSGQTPTSAQPASRRRYLSLTLGAACLIVLLVSPVVYHQYFASHPTAFTLPKGVKAAANPEAQEFYLQGLYHWNKRTPEDLHQAVDDFTQSIVHDPNYAPAYAGLANSYNLLREYTLMPSKDAYPRAIAAAQRAIALDDSLPDAHNSLAFADFYWSWDRTSAEREFRRAIELDPNSVDAHHWYATFLIVLGRSNEALAEIQKARELDPRSSSILADKGLILFLAGQKDQAVSLLRKLESSDPDFLSPHRYLSVIALATGDYKNFLPEFRKTALLLHDSDRLVIADAAEKGFAAAGGPGLLRAMLSVQQFLLAQDKVPAYDLAATYCLLGDRQQSLRMLQLAIANRDADVVGLRVDKDFQSLHDNPDFQKLVAQVGLPPLG